MSCIRNYYQTFNRGTRESPNWGFDVMCGATGEWLGSEEGYANEREAEKAAEQKTDRYFS